MSCRSLNYCNKRIDMHLRPGKEEECDDESRADLTILKERYAKGELGTEEYLKVREDILSDDK